MWPFKKKTAAPQKSVTEQIEDEIKAGRKNVALDILERGHRTGQISDFEYRKYKNLILKEF